MQQHAHLTLVDPPLITIKTAKFKPEYEEKVLHLLTGHHCEVSTHEDHVVIVFPEGTRRGPFSGKIARLSRSTLIIPTADKGHPFVLLEVEVPNSDLVNIGFDPKDLQATVEPVLFII